MKTTLRALLLATAVFAAFPAFAEDTTPDAAKEAAAKPSGPVKDFPILKVGSEDVKNSEVMDVWKNLFPGNAPPDFATFDEKIRQNVLRGVASELLIYQEAVKAGTTTDPDVKKRIAQVDKQVVMQSFMEKKAKEL